MQRARYEARLKFETDTISKMGFQDTFVIVLNYPLGQGKWRAGRSGTWFRCGIAGRLFPY